MSDLKNNNQITISGIVGIPEIKSGDNLAELICKYLNEKYEYRYRGVKRSRYRGDRVNNPPLRSKNIKSYKKVLNFSSFSEILELRLLSFYNVLNPPNDHFPL